MAQRRSLWRQIFNNFINSLKPRKYWGELKGTDYLGTDYYEGFKSSHSKRHHRWFVPSDSVNFEQEIPPEWEAWLRYRRKEPPTEEEISLNIQKMKKTIENYKKLEESRSLSSAAIKTSTITEFPKYKEFDSEYKTSQKKKDQQ